MKNYNYNNHSKRITHYKKIYIPILKIRINESEKEIKKYVKENRYEDAKKVFDVLNNYFEKLTKNMNNNIYPNNLKEKISELEEMINSEEESLEILTENI